MAKMTVEDLLKSVATVLGDEGSTSDAGLQLMQDIKDSCTPNTDTRDTDAELKALDDKWRKKYRDAFFNGTGGDSKDKEEDNDTQDDDKPSMSYAPTKPISFDTLFETKE